MLWPARTGSTSSNSLSMLSGTNLRVPSVGGTSSCVQMLITFPRTPGLDSWVAAKNPSSKPVQEWLARMTPVLMTSIVSAFLDLLVDVLTGVERLLVIKHMNVLTEDVFEHGAQGIGDLPIFVSVAGKYVEFCHKNSEFG